MVWAVIPPEVTAKSTGDQRGNRHIRLHPNRFLSLGGHAYRESQVTCRTLMLAKPVSDKEFTCSNL